jgi:hypothetical protein
MMMKIMYYNPRQEWYCRPSCPWLHPPCLVHSHHSDSSAGVVVVFVVESMPWDILDNNDAQLVKYTHLESCKIQASRISNPSYLTD